MEDEQRQRIAEWFTTKWKHGPCPVCETNEWAPNPKLGQITNFTADELEINVVPVFLVYCTNCGYTLPINALVAGICPAREIPPPDAFDLAAHKVPEGNG